MTALPSLAEKLDQSRSIPKSGVLPSSTLNAAQEASQFGSVAPILVTKLYRPAPRLEMIARPRLIARLDAGLHRTLTLVAAPAGFGKTTLVASWVAGSGRRVAWLSLDAGESDPARFLAYLVAALQKSGAALGAGLLGALQAASPPSTEALLTTLLNEIAALPDQIHPRPR